MSVKAQLFQTIDMIPEADLSILLEVARRFVPIDIDDIATPDDLLAHEIAMQEYENGEAVSFDEIDWD